MLLALLLDFRVFQFKNVAALFARFLSFPLILGGFGRDKNDCLLLGNSPCFCRKRSQLSQGKVP